MQPKSISETYHKPSTYNPCSSGFTSSGSVQAIVQPYKPLFINELLLIIQLLESFKLSRSFSLGCLTELLKLNGCGIVMKNPAKVLCIWSCAGFVMDSPE
jgi:hypothetical protein